MICECSAAASVLSSLLLSINSSFQLSASSLGLFVRAGKQSLIRQTLCSAAGVPSTAMRRLWWANRVTYKPHSHISHFLRIQYFWGKTKRKQCLIFKYILDMGKLKQESLAVSCGVYLFLSLFLLDTSGLCCF